jgi:hypothetical protein
MESNMEVMTMSEFVDLKAAKADAVEKLLRPHGNIVGIGIGKKVVNGVEIDCLRVYVVAKSDTSDLPCKDVVPGDIRVPTDVIEVGRFGRVGHPPKTVPRRPPAPDGIPGPGSRIRVRTNAPNVNEGARGTFGTVVTDGTSRYILGCNHLLAVNGRIPQEAADLVSSEFLGSERTIAGNMTYTYIKLNCHQNSVDCAMVKLPRSNHKVPTSFPDGHKLSSATVITPDIGMPVTKFGAITARTEGIIVDVSLDLYVDYFFGTFLLENQVMIQGTNDPNHFATGGDSGSLVVQALGMICAASGLFAVACPLENIVDRLKEEAKLPELELAVD